MNYARFNPRCYSGMEWSCEDDGDGDGDDDDDDPNEVQLDAVTMAMFSSLREGISPADFSLPESFSLSVVFRHAEAAENSLNGSVGLRVSGG